MLNFFNAATRQLVRFDPRSVVQKGVRNANHRSISLSFQAPNFAVHYNPPIGPDVHLLYYS